MKQIAFDSYFSHDVPTCRNFKKPNFVYKKVSDLQQRLKIIRDADPKKLLTDGQLGLGYFKNKYDCYRWSLIREGYRREMITFDHVKTIYKDWRDTPESLWLDGYDGDSAFIQTIAVPASKRGNEVYKERVSAKLSFLDGLEQREFFDDAQGRKKTPMIFITHDVDANKYTFDEAWEKQSYELHLFETKLRKEYGKFVKFKGSEAHKSGYPHKHTGYYFLNHEFEVFEHTSVTVACNHCRKRYSMPYKKSLKINRCKHCGSDDINKSVPNRTFRISNAERQKIKDMWRMGKNLDVQAIQDTLGVFSEVKKYVTKTIWNDKGLNTAAALSLFNQKSYYISTCNPWTQYPKLEDNGHRYCNMCGAPMDKEYMENHYYARHAHCTECDRKTLVVDFIPRYKDTEKFNEYLEKWRKANMNKFMKKDFVGCIWGEAAYKQLYKLYDDGLQDPGFDALVKETMRSCNEEFPEIAFFVYRGTFRTADIDNFAANSKIKHGPYEPFWFEPSPECKDYFNLNDLQDLQE